MAPRVVPVCRARVGEGRAKGGVYKPQSHEGEEITDCERDLGLFHPSASVTARMALLKVYQQMQPAVHPFGVRRAGE